MSQNEVNVKRYFLLRDLRVSLSEGASRKSYHWKRGKDYRGLRKSMLNPDKSELVPFLQVICELFYNPKQKDLVTKWRR